jgi:ribonuclease HI
MKIPSISYYSWEFIIVPLLFFHFFILAIASPVQQQTTTTTTTTTITHLTLQFDGCLRPPRDPGFPTISRRMIACAACIGVVHNNEITPLAVGATSLPVTTESTSQHAEYEGLLMGLEWLVKFLSCQNKDFPSLQIILTDEDDIDSSALRRQPKQQQKQQHRREVRILIEGDCKTVTDQISGRSTPRKLESLYQRARYLLDQLISTENNHYVVLVEPEYHHIPRSQNSISDSLCNNLMNIVTAKSWIESINQLEQAESQISSSASLSLLLEDVTRNTKYSLRPHLYEMLVNLVLQKKKNNENNNELIIEIGKRLVEEESQNHKQTFRRGVELQIQGWKGLKQDKKANFLERKYRILLSNPSPNDDDSISSKLFTDNDPDMLNSLGDTIEGEWDIAIPDVWKPILDKWFISARNEKAAREEEGGSPLWIDILR